jgi:hypothetical protein
MLVIHYWDSYIQIFVSSMIELLRSIYFQQVKRDETQSNSSSASSMCQSMVQQLGNTT